MILLSDCLSAVSTDAIPLYQPLNQSYVRTGRTLQVGRAPTAVRSDQPRAASDATRENQYREYDGASRLQPRRDADDSLGEAGWHAQRLTSSCGLSPAPACPVPTYNTTRPNKPCRRDSK